MKLYYRENYLKKIRGFYHTDDIIKVITGVRRCGKSSLMEMIASEIKESGVPKENIIFIDLDKRGFKGIKTTDALEKLIDEKSASKLFAPTEYMLYVFPLSTTSLRPTAFEKYTFWSIRAADPETDQKY